MSTELLIALISLAGVLVSVVVSVVISLRATSTELQKMRGEIQQAYMGKLIEKRMETYPAFYCMLSDFAKKSWLATFTKDDIKLLTECTTEWHSKNSIFFSAQTNVASYNFFGALVKLKDKDVSFDELHEFVNGPLAEFELALKSDIGIFVVEFADPNKRFRTYTDLVHTVSKQNKGISTEAEKPRRI